MLIGGIPMEGLENSTVGVGEVSTLLALFLLDLWPPRWRSGSGEGGGEDDFRVVARLHRCCRVLCTHRTKHTIIWYSRYVSYLDIERITRTAEVDLLFGERSFLRCAARCILPVFCVCKLTNKKMIKCYHENIHPQLKHLHPSLCYRKFSEQTSASHLWKPETLHTLVGVCTVDQKPWPQNRHISSWYILTYRWRSFWYSLFTSSSLYLSPSLPRKSSAFPSHRTNASWSSSVKIFLAWLRGILNLKTAKMNSCQQQTGIFINISQCTDCDYSPVFQALNWSMLQNQTNKSETVNFDFEFFSKLVWRSIV